MRVLGLGSRRHEDRSEIRETYLSFFEERGHLRVPSASLMPAAGRHLDAAHDRRDAAVQALLPRRRGAAGAAPRRRARSASAPPTSRRSATPRRHLTFFEMLGNWSFGDYFKEESIAWGWELSVEGFGFDPERIWVTVFGGDEELGLGPDEEAIEIWKSARHARGADRPPAALGELLAGRADRALRPLLGDVLRPRRGVRRPDERPGDDTDRFLEYWNHVFMSYELAEDGSLRRLPTRNIDTGMGLERMAAILQGVDSVFETDVFRPLVELAEELSGRSYGEDAATTRAMRIIADHSRGMAFLIADGVVPSNEDRGYVLRRIMRRAIQQGRVLGLEAALAGPVRRADDRDDGRRLSRARRRARDDRAAGSATRRRASAARSTAAPSCSSSLVARGEGAETSWIDAADAFKLHDTYGFPYDLTKELLAEQGLSVDDPGFEALMEEQRLRARTGAATGTAPRTATRR